jgi:hypothetical protein
MRSAVFRVRTLAAATLVLFVSALPVSAQWRGAQVAAAGELRLGVAGEFSIHDSRFGHVLRPGSGEREPLATEDLLARISDEAFAPFSTLRAQLNTFFAAFPDIPFEIPEGGLGVTAGALEVSADHRVVPFDAELGLPGRFSVGVRVPLVQNLLTPRRFRVESGAVGWNPDPEWNRAVLAAVDSQFVLVGGNVFLPTATSPAGIALQERVGAATGEQLRLPDAVVDWIGRAGVAGAEGLIAGRFAGGRPQWELGDVEARVGFQLLGSRGALPRNGVAARAAVDLALRLPTGLASDADYLVLPRPETGLSGVSAGIRADVRGGRFGAAAAARLERLGETTLRQRTWGSPPEAGLVGEPVETDLRWNPGTRVFLEAFPYLLLVEELRLVGSYGFGRRAERYTWERTPPDGGPIETTVAEAGRTAHRWGLGLDYSTLDAYRRGQAGIPFEAGVHFRETFAGADGTPAARAVEMRLRLFFRVWGRGG